MNCRMGHNRVFPFNRNVKTGIAVAHPVDNNIMLIIGFFLNGSTRQVNYSNQLYNQLIF